MDNINQIIEKHTTQPNQIIQQLNQLLEDSPSEAATSILLTAGIRLKEVELFQLGIIVLKKTAILLENQASPSPTDLSKCYNNLGICLRHLGQIKDAIVYYEKVMVIEKKQSNKEGLSIIYNNLATAYYHLGNFSLALKWYEEALTIEQKLNDQTGVAISQMNIGMCWDMLGNLTASFEYHDLAYNYFEKVNRYGSMIRCLISTGTTHYRMGNPDQGIYHLSKALTINIDQQINNKVLEAKCHLNLGLCYHSKSNYQRAIAHLEKSVRLNQEVGTTGGLGKAYCNLGSSYQSLGDTKKAISYQDKYLILLKKTQDEHGLAQAYGNLGVAYNKSKNFDQAIYYFTKSMKITDRISDQHTTSIARINLANTYYNQGEFQQALNYYEEALKVNQTFVNSYELNEHIYLNNGNTLLALGQLDKSIEWQQKALDLNKKTANKNSEKTAHFNLMKSYLKKENLALAYEHGLQSLEIAKEILEELVEETDQLSFSENINIIYFHLILIGMKLNKHQEALYHIENSKSFALLSLLSKMSFPVPSPLTQLLKNLLQEESKLVNILRKIQLRHLRNTMQAPAPGQVEDLKKQLQTIYQDMQPLAPEYVAIRTKKTIGFQKIKRLLAS